MAHEVGDEMRPLTEIENGRWNRRMTDAGAQADCPSWKTEDWVRYFPAAFYSEWHLLSDDARSLILVGYATSLGG